MINDQLFRVVSGSTWPASNWMEGAAEEQSGCEQRWMATLGGFPSHCIAADPPWQNLVSSPLLSPEVPSLRSSAVKKGCGVARKLWPAKADLEISWSLEMFQDVPREFWHGQMCAYALNIS